MRKLNLGCGSFKKKGYVNVDHDRRVKPDVKYDLNKIPYPFKKNEFDLIEADHVLEHLKNPFKVMKELHRISKNNSLIIIKVPHFSRGFTHAEHKRGFDVSFPYYFNPSLKEFFTGSELEIKKMKLSWFSQPYLKKIILSKSTFTILSILGSIIDLIANSAPFLCSRFWCYLVGGFEEIEFQFIVKK